MLLIQEPCFDTLGSDSEKLRSLLGNLSIFILQAARHRRRMRWPMSTLKRFIYEITRQQPLRRATSHVIPADPCEEP